MEPVPARKVKRATISFRRARICFNHPSHYIGTSYGCECFTCSFHTISDVQIINSSFTIQKKGVKKRLSLLYRTNSYPNISLNTSSTLLTFTALILKFERSNPLFNLGI